MNPIIRAANVAKQYQLGSSQNSFVTLRDTVAEVVRAPLKRLRASHKAETVMALRDVSFKVEAGEVLGIIGRNGAGKSTLLKILARITEPSSGRIDLYGRVVSLLEVGTGFHPELTGQENIYLNGAIMGMSRAEIRRKFDEIVAFSEIEEFIDTPVKRYSSGMYLRLAFAVAAHLDPEILLVDEVLAVGDARFQRKCLDKMESVHQSGRTVLFVSHNMPAVTRLCPRTILLENGTISFDGPSHEAVHIYLGSGSRTNAAREWKNLADAPGNEVVRLRAVRVRSEDGQLCETIDIRLGVAVEMEFEVLQGGHLLAPTFRFINLEGVCVFTAIDHDNEWHRRPRPEGRFVTTAWIPGNFLSEGTLIISASIATLEPARVHFHERDIVAFHVIDSLEGNAARGDYAGPMPGIVRPLLNWTSEFVPANSAAQTRPQTRELIS
jgi:homopolymeric O-antigen transport system ATP-binding protein